MFVRTTRVTRRGKTYQYAQLVRSERRSSDGMPVHRVIANLGRLSAQEVENFKTALAASREGKVVVVRQTSGRRLAVPKPRANLRYLDVAVLLELWRQWELDEVFDELMPKGQSSLCPGSVVVSLSLQRCVAPGSKLRCTRWLPQTALPELLGIDPALFNNTRVHRVLELLEKVEPQIQAALTKKYQQRDGAFATLFLDLTDAWFVGHGPGLAEHAKTKEGLIKRKIGIAILCNERGYPLRWDVVSGKKAENDVMGAMFRSVANLRWAGHVPIVCDRAMGTTDGIQTMLETQQQFITLLRSNEFEAYCPDIPWEIVAGFEVPDSQSDDDDDEGLIKKIAQQLKENTAMSLLSEHCFAMDFGVVERHAGRSASLPATAPARHAKSNEEDRTVRAMRWCRELTMAVADGSYRTYQAAGRAFGLTPGNVKKYRGLRSLAQNIQHDILAGRASGRSLGELLQLAAIQDEQEQFEAFEALLKSPKPWTPGAIAPGPKEPESPVRVRAVAFFDIERFIQQRRNANQKLQQIRSYVAKLNASLTNRRSKVTRDIAFAEIHRELKRHNLLNVFTVTVVEAGEANTVPRKHLHVAVDLDTRKWQQRRRYDGFSVLVAAPSVSLCAAELDQCYRAKDMVEKDFRVIKSVLQLRPVWHRNDEKVRAHVILCMLALLLERTLRDRLKGQYSSEAALEILAPCHLNQYRDDEHPSVYLITQPSQSQQAILRLLDLSHLTNDDILAEAITPR